jgi:hypothetical protein
MHRLARSLTNESCDPLLIWNGTLFSKMAPWCGQVRGHSLFDKKFFPIPGYLCILYSFWYFINLIIFPSYMLELDHKLIRYLILNENKNGLSY